MAKPLSLENGILGFEVENLKNGGAAMKKKGDVATFIAQT